MNLSIANKNLCIFGIKVFDEGIKMDNKAQKEYDLRKEFETKFNQMMIFNEKLTEITNQMSRMVSVGKKYEIALNVLKDVHKDKNPYEAGELISSLFKYKVNFNENKKININLWEKKI